ncbi:hypothetical protein [Burkholderia gladioli]|uniref:hypothetical protein n=1 Tax=Burkholderia gladioli TaxID=28095 RepID=UPI0016422800|nr:hypothetical protein [Burkholderia gladioli]
MKKIGLIALNVVVTLAGGWVLGTLIISQAGNMPEWMDHALRVLLHITGSEELANPDDLPTLGMLAILIASIIVCGLLVWIANVAIGRARTRRAQA